MDDVTEVIRARRVEVVDGDGRVRVVVGLLGQGEGDVFGLAVKAADGRDRAWLVAEGATAEVGLDFGGNTVASISVGERGDVDLFVRD